MRHAALFLVLLAASCCAPSGVSARKVPPPTVLLLADEGGVPRGSGVVISDGWALTAAHVDNVVTAGGLPVTERHDHPFLDLALLRVPEARGSVTFAEEQPDPWERISCYGWHMGQVLLRTDGYQSPAAEWGSSPVIFGCSGGACVNERGELVGIIRHVGLANTPMGDSYAVVQIMGYTAVTLDVLGWIQTKAL